MGQRFGIAQERAADDGRIGVRREAARWRAHAQIGAVHASSVALQAVHENPDDGCGQRCVLWRSARNRYDLAVGILVANGAYLLDAEIIRERPSMP